MSRQIDWNKLNYEVDEIYEEIEKIKPVQKIKKKVKPVELLPVTNNKKKHDRKLSLYK